MKGKRRRWDRAYAVGRARRLLHRRGRPRAQMSAILMLTGSAGFLFSYALLHAGVTSMALRYPAVIFLAYGVFLLLLRGWLALQRRRYALADHAEDADVVLDVAELDVGGRIGVGGGGGDFVRGSVFGGGGDFGGGGAVGDWEGGAGSPSGGGGSFLGDIDIDLPAGDDDGCLAVFAVLAAVAAVVAGLLATFYVIYVAPALLAEVLVDGLLVTGLYRRLRHVEERHWLRTAVRRTLAPVALTLLFFTLAGYLMQRAAPEARSFAGFWESITSGR